MTPDAVRVVREFLGRDLAESAEMLHPEVVWFGTRGGLDQDQVLRGPDAALAYMQEIREPWELFDVDVERVVDAGDSVLVFLREMGRTHGGPEVQNETAMIFKVRDQKVVEMTGYLDRAAAIIAASLEWAEVVRLGFDALAQADFATLEQWTTPDVVIVQPPEVPDAKTYEGRVAMAQAWADWPSQWEDFRLDLIEILPISDDVVVSVTRHRGRGRESGIEMDFQVFYVHYGRDGKLARMEMFFTREQALAAARE